MNMSLDSDSEDEPPPVVAVTSLTTQGQSKRQVLKNQEHPKKATPTSSSSSSSSSSSTTTSTSTSTSSPSSEESTTSLSEDSNTSTIIESKPFLLRHKIMVNKREDVSSSEEPIISSESSVKRYKNSPFGLSNHYLTMPDINTEIINKSLNRIVAKREKNPQEEALEVEIDGREEYEVAKERSQLSNSTTSETTNKLNTRTKRSKKSNKNDLSKKLSSPQSYIIKPTQNQKGLYSNEDHNLEANSSDKCDLSVLATSSSSNSPSPSVPSSAHSSPLLSPHIKQHQSSSPSWSGYDNAHHHLHSSTSNHHQEQLATPIDSSSDLNMDHPSSSPLPSPSTSPHHHHHHHHHHHLRRHHHHHHEHDDHFTRPNQANLMLPAGDAGLDAKKCNAKSVGVASGANIDIDSNNGNRINNHKSECFYDSSKDLNVLHDKKLKIQEMNRISQEQGSGGLLVRFSSIMYATFLVILGCILHVSELRQKSKNSSDHIYTIIVALIGIIWLIFLQTDLQRYKKYATKYILIETIFNDSRQKRRELAQAGGGGGGSGLVGDPSARSTTSSSASLVNDRMSMNTEVIFKKTAYKMYQRRAEFEHNNNNKMYGHRNRFANNNNRTTVANSTVEPFDVFNKSTRDAGSVKDNSSSTTDVADMIGGGGEGFNRDHLVPAYKFLHGKMGANFYLKCGMAAFCFGHVIHEGLRFGQQVYFFGTSNVHCRDLAALIAHLITPLYSFYQLFMMFKYSNLVINRHKILARFGLMHIIGTSVTFWFRTIFEEAFEDFVHKMDYFRTNKPHNYNFAHSKISQNDSSLEALLNSISNAIKAEASERSDWSFSNQDQNVTLAHSLLTLMSSPISATITPQMVKHLPESYACAQNTLLTTKSMNALPYLYPFTIEYNLLLAATFLSLYFNIGKIGLAANGEATCKPFLFKSSRNYHNNMATKPRSYSSSPGSHFGSIDNSSALRLGEANSEKEMGEYKSNFVVNADCHSANKGLFCGFFVLLVTLVTIVIFFVTINKPTHIQLGIKINLIQEATLTTLILIVTLAGFKQVVKLNRNPYLKDKVTTDNVLMLIPLPFFFIHSLLSFRAETASMSSGSMSYFSSKLLHGQSHVVPHHDSITAPSGNLQSIFLSTNNNNNNNNNILNSNNNNINNGNNNTQIETRSNLNNLLAGHPSNGTSGRSVEAFISSSRGNNIRNRNSNNNNNNNNSADDIRSSSGISNSSRNISNFNASSSSALHIDHFKLITVALNIIVMIEVLVQTNFIIDGMRRCSESRYLRFKKPGRELITFAILLNITYWIVATFETKSVEQYKTEIEYYGPLPYMFISHTTLPVMLFYRYHSSVCLAEIWNRAYKPPKKR